VILQNSLHVTNGVIVTGRIVGKGVVCLKTYTCTLFAYGIFDIGCNCRYISCSAISSYSGKG